MSEVNKVSDMNNPADYDLGAEEILQEEIAIQHLMEGYIMPNILILICWNRRRFPQLSSSEF